MQLLQHYYMSSVMLELFYGGTLFHNYTIRIIIYFFTIYYFACVVIIRALCEATPPSLLPYYIYFT